MDPSQTSFFQALAIATKINKGTIEIVSDVHIIRAGDKVGASEAALLGKLGVKPFRYGLEVVKVFDNGSLFEPAVLEITDEDMEASVGAALANIAALCLATNYPTLASIPHSVINGYKNVLAIAIETDYSFPLADKVCAGTVLPCAPPSRARCIHAEASTCTLNPMLPLPCQCASVPPANSFPNMANNATIAPVTSWLQVKEYLKNPGAFAAAAPAASAAAAPAAAAAPEPEEEEEEDMGFSLFD
jgi:Insertion domain in 60S ribosomal protein L10P/60s Acidic ribosomal protein